MHAPIKTFFFFAFLAALPARGDAPVIAGTDLAICGQGADLPARRLHPGRRIPLAS